MKLTPAYEAERGLTQYTREFFFESDGRIRLVDTIAASKPHRFTWLFHSYKSDPITSGPDGRFTIQKKAEKLTLELVNSSVLLCHAINDTLVVWAYVNENQDETFHHLEFETKTPVQEARIEIEMI